MQRTVQAFEAIANINELYLCDDQQFLVLLDQSLEKFKNRHTAENKITDEMVALTQDDFAASAYERLQQSVFSKDKIGAVAVLMKYLKPNVMTEQIFQYFTDQIQVQEKSFENIIGGYPEQFRPSLLKALTALGQSVVQEMQMTNTSQWSGFYSKLLQSKDFSSSLLPDAVRKLNGTQKAVLVSAIRPDLLCQLLQ